MPFSFLIEIWEDLHRPSLAWQIGAILVCLLLGWGVARLLSSMWAARSTQSRVTRLGENSFSRVLAPLFSLAFLALAKLILAHWHHVNLLRLLMPMVAAFALMRLVFYVLRRIFGRKDSGSDSLLSLLEKCFAVLVWAGFALYVADLWPDLLQYLEESVIPIGKHQVAVLVILQAAASVAVTLMLALWASAALETRLMRVDSMHPSLRAVMSRAGRAILILVAILLSLSMVGIDLTVLSVFGGALGVGLGLGLQKIASNYVSGFIILLDRSLAIGDMINVDKYYGKVTQINTRYTVVQGLDGVETVVPNEMLVSSPVQNYSLTSRNVLMTSIVIVSFETDVSHALALLQEASQEVARILQDPPPALYLSRFAESGLELQIGFWIGDPENGRQSVLSDLNRAIWRRFQEHKIHVPKPQREIRLIDDRLGAR